MRKNLGLKNLGILSLIVILFVIIQANMASADIVYNTTSDVYGVFVDSSSLNVTNYLNLTFQMRACSLADCSDASWSSSYTNASYTSLASLANAHYFQYKATFFTENQNYTPYLFNATIDYTYLDTTYPQISFSSPTPSNNSGAIGSFTINISITDENLVNLTYNWNGSSYIYNTSTNLTSLAGSNFTFNLTSLGSGNYVLNITQSGLVFGQSYTYYVSVLDYAGNINSTETRTIRGNSVPSFASVSYTPNSTDESDPGVSIAVTANISDIDSNFDSAILQWKNGSVGAGWNNISMANITAKSTYTILNATLTLPSYESNITFRILANDTTGDSAYSENYTLQSFWDCTWTATSDLDAVSGWDENKFVGNITINNTGDSAYSSSNCSLDFRLSYDLVEGRIYYDGEYIKNLNSYTIAAKSNQTIQINATFLTEVKQENVLVTLDEFRTRSSARYRNTTAVLVSNQGGPYMYQSISSYPTSVYLTNANFSLNGYLRNLMGSATENENNTAYNVSFYWTLPSSLTNSSGNLTVNYTNITDNNLHYNNINVGFSSLASETSGVKTFYLNSKGYNISGSLIQDASGNLNLTNSVNISFLCYSTSDGVCVTSCGYLLDSDCSASTTAASSTSSGGGGSATSTVAVRTSADFQLIRGEQNEVKITFENSDKNESIRNLVFSVSGKISKYIDISPKTLPDLGAGQKATIILTITSPTYIALGKQEIIITMNGEKGSSGYVDSKKITLEIHELSIERASQMLNESRGLIKQLNEANLSSEYLNSLLNESEAEMKTFNLEVVRNNYNVIKEQAKYALDTSQIIGELESLIKSAGEKGIDVSESVKLLKLARLSIERREFAQAYSRIKDAQLTYALEIKGEYGKLSYYLKEYPGEISLAAVFLIVFSFGTYKINRLRIVKKRIRELKEEEKILNELIKVVQKDCFKDKKMSMGEYETAIKEYNRKLSKVIEELIEMEIKRVHMLRFTSKSSMLKLEKEKIISLIKELQDDYMKKKKVETRTFELKMESFNKRISEIEEKLATLEAEKAVKGISLKMANGELK